MTGMRRTASGFKCIEAGSISGWRDRSGRHECAPAAVWVWLWSSPRPVLFSGSIGDNIRYGRLEATPEEVERAAEVAHVDHFIKRLPQGYDTALATAGGTLSGGERQRLGIARAVLKDAPILILDEPTSSLDALSEEAVFQALRSLRAGRTILVIAHRLSTIRDANRILVLHEGKLIAQGTHDQLLESNELYRRMCARLSVGKSLDEPESVDEVLKALA